MHRPREWVLEPFEAECVLAVQGGARTVKEVMAATGQKEGKVSTCLSRLAMRDVLRAVRRDDRQNEFALRGRLEQRDGKAVFVIDAGAPASDVWGPLQRKVLEVLDDGKAHGVVEVAGRIGEPVSATYRCLLGLDRHGYVEAADFVEWLAWEDRGDLMPAEEARFRLAKEWRRKWRTRGV